MRLVFHTANMYEEVNRLVELICEWAQKTTKEQIRFEETALSSANGIPISASSTTGMPTLEPVKQEPVPKSITLEHIFQSVVDSGLNLDQRVESGTAVGALVDTKSRGLWLSRSSQLRSRDKSTIRRDINRGVAREVFEKHK